MNEHKAVGPFSISVPISLEAHFAAREFCREHADPIRARQVYLNTLAVSAVNFYLRCLGLEPDLQASSSYDPVMQAFLDIADLKVQGYGVLECRPVLPHDRFCYVPPETHAERIGYIAVQLSESLKEATLLGFVEQVATEKLLLSELRSLEDFPDYLSSVKQTPANLSQWLQGTFEAGWQAVESLLNPVEPGFAFRFGSIQRCKLIDWGGGGISAILMVMLMPDRQSERLDISVEVLPPSGQPYLPPELQLLLLDEKEDVVMEAKAKQDNQNIRFRFEGEKNDNFSIRVALGQVSVTEAFII
ncbi:MAG: DUF1822 family protein [Coleofasciculaceae cyanobacterium SM2_3_26]|nr:DUF1822 family protein [Coleofasciculaceae cyanobacterium SM2_3_26]